MSIKEPLPDTGWSRECVSYKNAIVCPATQAKFRQECGVWTSEGNCERAATWREDRPITLPLAERQEPATKLKGKHLYGGVFFGHFGHFIVETISRLWAVRDSGAESILFLPKHDKLTDFKGFQADLCELLQVDIPINVVKEPTEVEELIVPGQAFGLGKISRGTPEFHAMINKLREGLSEGGPEKIYISRTQFNGRGGIVNEKALEQNFIDQGYTPVHPQRLPVKEQLALFKNAKKIVGLDSSAFHLLGFVANPEQDVAIIVRRNVPAFTHIAEQLSAVLGRSPTIINALDADWMPEHRKLANHLSWGELNHKELAKMLDKHGFIEDSKSWTIPDQQAPDDMVEKAEKASREPLVRREVTNRVQ